MINSRSLASDLCFSPPGTTYTVRVQIRNKFGVSESLHVPVVTLLEPIKQLAETKVKEDTEERNEAILAMIIGGLVTLVMLVLVILLISFSYRRRLLEHSAASLGATSARLLETNPEHKQPGEMAEYSSYTLDSKQSTTTFNSNVFVPSISSDVYGQVTEILLQSWDRIRYESVCGFNSMFTLGCGQTRGKCFKHTSETKSFPFK